MRFFFLFVLLSSAGYLIGCGAPPDIKSVLDSGNPNAPVITSVTYYESAVLKTVTGPFTTAVTVSPDLRTGLCSAFSNFGEVTLKGTFDTDQTDHFELTGSTYQNVTLSGNNFSIKTCIAIGSTLIGLKAFSGTNLPSPLANVSLKLQPIISTIGDSHPRYPNPGFRTGALSASSTSLNGTTLTARQISIDEIGNQTITSTGNTSLTFETGFTNVVKQISP